MKFGVVRPLKHVWAFTKKDSGASCKKTFFISTPLVELGCVGLILVESGSVGLILVESGSVGLILVE